MQDLTPENRKTGKSPVIIQLFTDLLIIAVLLFFSEMLSKLFIEYSFYTSCLVALFHPFALGMVLYLHMQRARYYLADRTFFQRVVDKLESFSFIFVLISFSWILFPWIVMQYRGVIVPPLAPLLVLLLVLSFVGGGLGYARGERDNDRPLAHYKYLPLNVVIAVYVIYASVMILSSLALLPAFMMSVGGVIWVFLFYLPFRFLAMYRSRYAALEMGSIFLVCLIFIFKMIMLLWK